MRNRFVMTLALTSVLSLGGMALAKTPTAAKTQNTNSAGSTTPTARHKTRKASHRRRRHARHHRKSAPAANANR